MNAFSDTEYGWFVRWFLSLIAGVVVVVGTASFVLYRMDLPYTNNDDIRQYQLARLAEHPELRAVIVGDSSAGNAVDEHLFGEITGSATLNLALTGGFGIEGSYEMIRHAQRAAPGLKYVLVVQTLDIWYRAFAEQGVLDLADELPCASEDACAHPLSVTKYLFNPKEILWAVRYLRNGPATGPVFDNGYLVQGEERYDNGKKTLEAPRPIPPVVHPSKREALERIDALCKAEGLTCVYLHGPLHADIAAVSGEALTLANGVLATATSLRSLPDLLALPSAHMGDATDHAAPAYKDESTRWYASRFLELIAE